MIKLVTLFGLYGLSVSVSHRTLLQQPQNLPLPPPGHTYGAFSQFCPHPEPGIAVCGKTTEVAQDTSNPGSMLCERPGDCCLCSSISCGSDPQSPCEMFSVGEKGVFGVKNIDITGDANVPALIDCKGAFSCAQTVIRASAISKIQCGGRFSCKDAIIIIDAPNEGFELKCAVTGACEGLQIAVNVPAPPTGISCGAVSIPPKLAFGSIECIGVAACERMQFILNNDGCEQVVIESIECRDGSCEGADFQFNGNVMVETCALSGQGGQPLGLETCFTGLLSLTCPSYQSCVAQERIVMDPNDGFELKCEGVESCKGAIFTLEISTRNRASASPIIPVYVDCIENNACQDMIFIVDNANDKQVTVNVRCMKEGSCNDAMFINGLNVVIEEVFCLSPAFCMGCRKNGVLCHANAGVPSGNGPAVVV